MIRQTLCVILAAFMVGIGMPAAAQTAEETESLSVPTTTEVKEKESNKALVLNKGKKYVLLNRHPQNLDRQVDWKTESVIVLTQDSPERIWGSSEKNEDGSIKTSTGSVPAGIAIAVDRYTHKSLWVISCGNEDNGPGEWIVQGKLLIAPGKEYDECVQGNKDILDQLNIIKEQLVRIEAAVGNLPTLDQIRGVVREELKEAKTRKAPLPELSFTGWFKGTEIQGIKLKRGSVVILEWSSRYTIECHSLTGVGFHTGGLVEGRVNTPPLKTDQIYTVECSALNGGRPISARVIVDINNHNVLWVVVVGATIIIIASSSHGGGSSKSGAREGPPIPLQQ